VRLSRVQNCFDTLSFKKCCKAVNVYLSSQVSRYQDGSNSEDFTSLAFLYMHLSLRKEARRSSKLIIKLCSDQFCADTNFQKLYLQRRASNWTDRGFEYVSGQEYMLEFSKVNICENCFTLANYPSYNNSFFLWLYSPLLDPGRFFQFLNPIHSR
jgi:hypothetical protein